MSSSVNLIPFDHPAALRRDLARRVAALVLVAVALSGWVAVLKHHYASSLAQAAAETERMPVPSALAAERYEVAVATHVSALTPTSPSEVVRTHYQTSTHP